MRPRLVEIPIPFTDTKIPIFGYGFMLIVGLLAATALASRAARKRGIRPEHVWDFGVYVVLFGILGARVFFILQYWQESFAGKPFYRIFFIWEGGLVLYGGVATAVLAGYVYLRRHRIPIPDFLDGIGPYVPVGLAVGRLGCFLNGCCWGHLVRDGFPLGVRFPAHSLAWQAQQRLGVAPPDAALAVHPTQLYAFAHGILLWLLLAWYVRRGAPRGSVTPLLGILYGVGRFAIEVLRADTDPVFAGLKISQVLSLIVVPASAFFLLHFIRASGRERTRLGVGGSGARGQAWEQ